MYQTFQDGVGLGPVNLVGWLHQSQTHHVTFEYHPVQQEAGRLL